MMFFPCLSSVMFMEMAAPKAIFPFRTNTLSLLSCWSLLYREGLSGICVLHSKAFFFLLDPLKIVCFHTIHLSFSTFQSVALRGSAAVASVGKRHQGDGQRTLHAGNQCSSIILPAALSEHTQQQGGGRFGRRF